MAANSSDAPSPDGSALGSQQLPRRAVMSLRALEQDEWSSREDRTQPPPSSSSSSSSSGYRLALDADLSNADVASMDRFLPANNVGYQMLLKMGWTQGTGIGKRAHGRLEPIRIDSDHELGLGLGRLTFDREKASEATASRRLLESEIEETDEVRQRRVEQHAKETRIKQELETINRPFYCELCNKQYTKATEWDAHLSSYDHHHKKRFMEMKQMQGLNRPVPSKRDKKGVDREMQAAMAMVAKAQQQQQQVAGPQLPQPPRPPQPPQQSLKPAGAWAPHVAPAGPPAAASTPSSSTTAESSDASRTPVRFSMGFGAKKKAGK